MTWVKGKTKEHEVPEAFRPRVPVLVDGHCVAGLVLGALANWHPLLAVSELGGLKARQALRDLWPDQRRVAGSWPAGVERAFVLSSRERWSALEAAAEALRRRCWALALELPVGQLDQEAAKAVARVHGYDAYFIMLNQVTFMSQLWRERAWVVFTDPQRLRQRRLVVLHTPEPLVSSRGLWVTFNRLRRPRDLQAVLGLPVTKVQLPVWYLKRCSSPLTAHWVITTLQRNFIRPQSYFTGYGEKLRPPAFAILPGQTADLRPSRALWAGVIREQRCLDALPLEQILAASEQHLSRRRVRQACSRHPH